MTAAILDLAVIKARRAAAAAEARKDDPLSNPTAVRIVERILHQMILMDQAMRELFSIEGDKR